MPVHAQLSHNSPASSPNNIRISQEEYNAGAEDDNEYASPSRGGRGLSPREEGVVWAPTVRAMMKESGVDVAMKIQNKIKAKQPVQTTKLRATLVRKIAASMAE